MPHKTHTLMLIRHIYANHLNVVGKCCDFVQSICARNQSIWCSGVLLWSNSIHSHCGYFHSRFRMVFAQLIHNIVVIMIIIIIMRLFFKKNLNIILLIHVCVHVYFYVCITYGWMDGFLSLCIIYRCLFSVEGINVMHMRSVCLTPLLLVMIFISREIELNGISWASVIPTNESSNAINHIK